MPSGILKTIVNLPAATTTKTMLHVEFPVGEKTKEMVQELPSLTKFCCIYCFHSNSCGMCINEILGCTFFLFANKTWLQINMSSTSVDIPRLLTGNECIPYRPLNPGSCVVCRKSTGNQDCCKSLVSQFVCQAKCHQCQQLLRSLQQLCCQHKRCRNQSSPLSFPSSPLMTRLLF